MSDQVLFRQTFYQFGAGRFDATLARQERPLSRSRALSKNDEPSIVIDLECEADFLVNDLSRMNQYVTEIPDYFEGPIQAREIEYRIGSSRLHVRRFGAARDLNLRKKLSQFFGEIERALKVPLSFCRANESIRA